MYRVRETIRHFWLVVLAWLYLLKPSRYAWLYYSAVTLAVLAQLWLIVYMHRQHVQERLIIKGRLQMLMDDHLNDDARSN